MSIIRCDRHDIPFDSDTFDLCPCCETETPQEVRVREPVSDGKGALLPRVRVFDRARPRADERPGHVAACG